MRKLLLSFGVALLTIPSLCYYTAKYYIYKNLTFEESMIFIFSLFCSLMIFGLLFSVYNAYQNLKLHNKIQELENKIEQYHYDNLEYHENNRELILDLNKGDK